MNSYLRKIFLFINLNLILLSCSSEPNLQQDSSEENNLVPNIQIGASKKDTEAQLIKNGYQLNDDKLTKISVNLDHSIILTGNKSISSWKAYWKGDPENLERFLKRLKNILTAYFPELKGSNGYYACRYKKNNEEFLLELFIWENKIELTHRKGH